MDATAALLLLQVPPVTASVSVVVSPAHIDERPLIGARAFTATFCTAVQPVTGIAKVIFAVPAATPVTTPVDAPTVATPALLLLHVLLPDPSLSVVVRPAQTVNTPVMDAGDGLTVAVRVTEQPVVFNVNVMVVVPADTPDKTPEAEPIVAVLVLLLIQVPAPDPSVNVVAEPSHKPTVPEMPDGSALTVTTRVVLQPFNV